MCKSQWRSRSSGHRYARLPTIGCTSAVCLLLPSDACTLRRRPAYTLIRHGSMSETIRVLIIEDDPIDADLMVRELKRGGFDPAWVRVETEERYIAELEKNP